MDQLGLLQQANNAWHNREFQRYEFVLDYLKMCTVADIPLETTEKMRPVLQKHCKQEGALPQVPTLRTTYVPRLYKTHFQPSRLFFVTSLLVSLLTKQHVRDVGILSVIDSV